MASPNKTSRFFSRPFYSWSKPRKISGILLILAVFFTSCFPYQKEENLRKVDELLDQIQKTQEMQKIDIDEVKDRYEKIIEARDYVTKNYHKDSIDLEIQNIMTRYRALWKNYQYFIKNYQSQEMDTEIHLERIQNLKKDVIEQNLSQDEFGRYYKKEKEILEKHHENVKKTVGSVVHIEQMYQRSKKEIDEVIQEIKDARSLK